MTGLSQRRARKAWTLWRCRLGCRMRSTQTGESSKACRRVSQSAGRCFRFRRPATSGAPERISRAMTQGRSTSSGRRDGTGMMTARPLDEKRRPIISLRRTPSFPKRRLERSSLYRFRSFLSFSLAPSETDSPFSSFVSQKARESVRRRKAEKPSFPSCSRMDGTTHRAPSALKRRGMSAPPSAVRATSPGVLEDGSCRHTSRTPGPLFSSAGMRRAHAAHSRSAVASIPGSSGREIESDSPRSSRVVETDIPRHLRTSGTKVRKDSVPEEDTDSSFPERLFRKPNNSFSPRGRAPLFTGYPATDQCSISPIR